MDATPPPDRKKHRVVAVRLASAALAQAGEAYGGALLDGVAYGWVEGPREDTRRWAVDALARLAELRQAADDLPGAVEALERAIIADPVAEELYRRLMRLQADLERPDAERRTYRPLARRLAELQSRTGTSSSNSPCRATRSSWQTPAWISPHPAA